MSRCEHANSPQAKLSCRLEDSCDRTMICIQMVEALLGALSSAPTLKAVRIISVYLFLEREGDFTVRGCSSDSSLQRCLARRRAP